MISLHKMCSFCAALDEVKFDAVEKGDTVVFCSLDAAPLLLGRICTVFRDHSGAQNNMWAM